MGVSYRILVGRRRGGFTAMGKDLGMSIAKRLMGMGSRQPARHLPLKLPGVAVGVLLASLLLGLGGCADKPMYYSTPELPATVWVNDANTAQPIWSMNVPVQYKLQVNFFRKGQD